MRGDNVRAEFLKGEEPEGDFKDHGCLRLKLIG